ncbi:MAG: SPOR domain-containing protein, partial [Phyllobacteriaceae bacterium]|nr:SPOR domain-containing protein [Phyllobacteriaceae bacterium]
PPKAPAKAPAATGNAPMALGPVAARPVAAAPVAAAPAAPTAIAPAAGGSGDWVVQISSSKSEAEARNSLAAAQRRYSALAGKSGDVQRADLGAKGTYYRARVSGGSREAASSLCAQVKAQGGDCVVVRR